MIEDSAVKVVKAPTAKTFEFRGETYAVPTSVDDIDGDFLEAIEEDKTALATRLLLGAEWDRFKRLNHPVKVKDINEFGAAAWTAFGAKAGE